MTARYRKHNDGSHSSSTYHKKDGTPLRAKLKAEAEEEVREWACYWTDPAPEDVHPGDEDFATIAD